MAGMTQQTIGVRARLNKLKDGESCTIRFNDENELSRLRHKVWEYQFYGNYRYFSHVDKENKIIIVTKHLYI